MVLFNFLNESVRLYQAGEVQLDDMLRVLEVKGVSDIGPKLGIALVEAAPFSADKQILAIKGIGKKRLAALYHAVEGKSLPELLSQLMAGDPKASENISPKLPRPVDGPVLKALPIPELPAKLNAAQNELTLLTQQHAEVQQDYELALANQGELSDELAEALIADNKKDLRPELIAKATGMEDSGAMLEYLQGMIRCKYTQGELVGVDHEIQQINQAVSDSRLQLEQIQGSMLATHVQIASLERQMLSSYGHTNLINGLSITGLMPVPWADIPSIGLGSPLLPDILTDSARESTNRLKEDELERLWRILEAIRREMNKKKKEFDKSPMVAEIAMWRLLYDMLTGAKDVPKGIWEDLNQFGQCNVGPLIDGIKTGEAYANSLLKLLHAITAILKGYLSDRLDAKFKKKLDSLKGVNKLALTLLLKLLKRQIPVIQREIDAGNWENLAKILGELKQGKFFGTLQSILSAVLDIFKDAIANAAEAGVRFALKLLLKRLLGSATAAAAALFILEDFVDFLDGLDKGLALIDLQKKYNKVLKQFLKRYKKEHGCLKRGKVKEQVWWQFPKGEKFKGHRLEFNYFVRCFCPTPDSSDKCAGNWSESPIQISKGQKTGFGITVKPKERQGDSEVELIIPPASPKCPGPCFVLCRIERFDAKGKLISSQLQFLKPIC